MSRGKNEFKTMEFTDSGVCKNAVYNGIKNKDAADQLNDAFDHNSVECKELDDNLIEEKSAAGKVGRALNEHALKPAITGATFGATSYGVGMALSEQKAKEHKKKIKDRAQELAARDLKFEVDHPRTKDGKFRPKPSVKTKSFIGQGAKKVGEVANRFKNVFKPQAPKPTVPKPAAPKPAMPKPKMRTSRSGGVSGTDVEKSQLLRKEAELARKRRAASGYREPAAPKPKKERILSEKNRRRLGTTAKYGAAGLGGLAAGDILSGRTRQRIKPEDPNDPFRHIR